MWLWHILGTQIYFFIHTGWKWYKDLTKRREGAVEKHWTLVQQHRTLVETSFQCQCESSINIVKRSRWGGVDSYIPPTWQSVCCIAAWLSYAKIQKKGGEKLDSRRPNSKSCLRHNATFVSKKTGDEGSSSTDILENQGTLIENDTNSLNQNYDLQVTPS